MKISIVLLSFLISTLNLFAQLDSKIVEQKTYAFYKNAQWDSLIDLGKQAHKQNIDYYYLNYRMGLAYFYKKKFFSASFYLERALKQNEDALNDTYFSEKLYLSYIYTLQYDYAMQIPIDSTNTGLKGMLLGSSVYAFGGGGSAIPLDNSSLEKNKNVDLAYMHYQQGQSLWGLAAHHQINPRVSLDIVYSNIKYSDVASVDVDDSLTIKTYTISQQNISIIPEFRINFKWQLRFAFGYSFSSGQPYILREDIIDSSYQFAPWDLSENNYLLGVNIYRRFRNVKLGLEMGVSNYSNTNQIQFGMNLMYYPFSNLNFYSYSSAAVKYEKGNPGIVLHQKLGFKTFSKLWMEVGGTFGEIKNYNVFSMGYGYNTTDNIEMIASAKAIYLISRNIEFFVAGHFYKRHGLKSEVYNLSVHDTYNVNYQYWSVTGGLIWKFKIQ